MEQYRNLMQYSSHFISHYSLSVFVGYLRILYFVQPVQFYDIVIITLMSVFYVLRTVLS